MVFIELDHIVDEHFGAPAINPQFRTPLFEHLALSNRRYHRQADKCDWLREGLKNVRHLVLDEVGLANTSPTRGIQKCCHVPMYPCTERLTDSSSRDTSRSWTKSWNFCGSALPNATSCWINAENSLPKVPVCGATSTATWQDMQRRWHCLLGGTSHLVSGL